MEISRIFIKKKNPTKNFFLYIQVHLKQLNIMKESNSLFIHFRKWNTDVFWLSELKMKYFQPLFLEILIAGNENPKCSASENYIRSIK